MMQKCLVNFEIGFCVALFVAPREENLQSPSVTVYRTVGQVQHLKISWTFRIVILAIIAPLEYLKIQRNTSGLVFATQSPKSSKKFGK